jgi:hypothetical protein
MRTDTPIYATTYAEVLSRYADQHAVTIATGATCAYLGDERNLREFLVADEIARWLRRAGHIVTFLLINDSMDALNFRQLRVAVNKDPALIERYQNWCGKPIAHLPDPWGCHESYASHFEEELVNRLHRFDCHPTLVSTAKLYERGLYAPYVRIVLERQEELLQFLKAEFPTYQPDKLYWVLCPHCRYIHETRVLGVSDECVTVYCEHCSRTSEIPFSQLQGKLNWKLDCAIRWLLFEVDVEPFNKSYLEPQSGTFVIAQTLANQFFGQQIVVPFQYGTVKMENKFSYKLLESLPASVLRSLLVDRPSTELKLSRELVVTAASRYSVLPGLTYLDFVKQLLPMWLLAPDKLTPQQRDYVAHGVSFGRHFLNTEIRLHLPGRAQFEGERPGVLSGMKQLLARVIKLRQESQEWEQFQAPTQQLIESLGTHKGPILHRLRQVVGQEQGLPAARFLFTLPLDYLELVEYLLELQLQILNEQVPDADSENDLDSDDLGSNDLASDDLDTDEITEHAQAVA